MEVVNFRVNGGSTKTFEFQKNVRVKAYRIEGDSKVGATVAMTFDDVKGESADGTPWKRGVETDSWSELSGIDIDCKTIKIENNSASVIALVSIFYEYE